MHVCAHALWNTCTCTYVWTSTRLTRAHAHAYSSCRDGSASLPQSSAGGPVAQSHSRQLALQPKGFASFSLIVAVETPCLYARKVLHLGRQIADVRHAQRNSRGNRNTHYPTIEIKVIGRHSQYTHAHTHTRALSLSLAPTWRGWVCMYVCVYMHACIHVSMYVSVCLYVCLSLSVRL